MTRGEGKGGDLFLCEFPSFSSIVSLAGAHARKFFLMISSIFLHGRVS